MDTVIIAKILFSEMDITVGRLLLAILLGYVVFTISGVQFASDLVSNPIATFHATPLWTWVFGILVLAGSFYTSVEK